MTHTRARARDRDGQPGADRRLRGHGDAGRRPRRRRSRAAISRGEPPRAARLARRPPGQCSRWPRRRRTRPVRAAARFFVVATCRARRYAASTPIAVPPVPGLRRGSLSVIVDDGRARQEVMLDTPALGLYLPPLIWSVQYRFSTDATLAVLASDPYDPADYIRDYEAFLALRTRARADSATRSGRRPRRSWCPRQDQAALSRGVRIDKSRARPLGSRVATWVRRRVVRCRSSASWSPSMETRPTCVRCTSDSARRCAPRGASRASSSSSTTARRTTHSRCSRHLRPRIHACASWGCRATSGRTRRSWPGWRRPVATRS